MQPCPVCTIPLGHRETCPSPSCPCYGLRSDSVEAEVAAERWRSRPSVAQSRTLTGHAALRILAKRVGDDPVAAQDVLLLQLRHMPKPDDD